MIDKGKLLEWIEANEYIFSEPYADHEEQIKCEAKLKVMSVLKRDIELGEFDEQPS